MAKRHFAFVALAVAALAFVGCDTAKETGRTIVSISNFNNGLPLESDVQVDDGTNPPYITEDVVPLTIAARPYNDNVTGTTHSDVVIDNYRVTWARTDGGTGVLATRNEACDIEVSSGDNTDAAIRLTTVADKTGPILSPLVGTLSQVTMRADIKFTGHEVGTTKAIEIDASVGVTFADFSNTQ